MSKCLKFLNWMDIREPHITIALDARAARWVLEKISVEPKDDAVRQLAAACELFPVKPISLLARYHRSAIERGHECSLWRCLLCDEIRHDRQRSTRPG